MAKRCETNVLILGKTGVGKTSLCNYIFGAEVMKTGAGRPVTGMGIFTETIPLSPELVLHLYDSWGLEADKSESWKALIQEVLEQHNVREIREWFHTIIYCLSAKAARVEDFDLDMIRALGKEGNPVLVVLTHCDVMNVETAITAMRVAITTKTGVRNQDIVEVSSHAKKLLSGKTTQAFGKEKIIHRIKVNLLDSISGKMPQILATIGQEKINSWFKDCQEVVQKQVSFLNPTSGKKEISRNDFFDRYAQEIVEEIGRESDALFNEAFEFYAVFSHQFSGNALVEATDQLRIPEITHFQIKKSDKIGTSIAGAVLLAIPVVGLLGKFAIQEKTRAYYREGLRHNKALLEDHLQVCVEILAQELKKINSGLECEE
ncbi:GTPase [Acetobacterium wieringae]|uniref:GTPase Era n=1 Tax=Acetobacterium wieringae TaxID=52694 RepID=A0A1F2PGJ1_9FIRM|nr:GTPase [Acetobacterium wieringae]OFV70185.1 GTPase Era [Acetobacterium wieringae]